MRYRSLPNTVKIKVIPDFFYANKHGIKKLVKFIVKDYCKGFNVEVTRPYSLTVVFAPYVLDDNDQPTPGLHVKYHDNDPVECVIYMNVKDMSTNDSVDTLKTLIHEIIHYCQEITDRHQSEYKGPYNYNPSEIEAIGLTEYYLELWQQKNIGLDTQQK